MLDPIEQRINKYINKFKSEILLIITPNMDEAKYCHCKSVSYQKQLVIMLHICQIEKKQYVYISVCVVLGFVGILERLPPPFFELNHIGKGLSGKEYNICTIAGETMAFDCVLCRNL